jgi:O-antigen/teichoic acid export membrane protein
MPTETAERNVGRISVAKAGAYAGGTNVVQLVCGLLATALLARFLGPAQKGVYDVYVATSMLFTVLLSLALNAGVTYVVASQPVNSFRLMRVLTLIAFAEGSVALLFLRGAEFVGLTGSIVPAELGRWGVPVVAFTTVLLAASTFYRAVLVGHHQFLAANYGDVGKQVFGILFILGAFAACHFVRVPVVYGMVIGNMAAVAAATLTYRRQVPSGTPKTDDIGLGRAFRFSLPSYFASTAQYVNNRIDLFFVYHYWGAADVGLYQTAVLIAQAINLLPVAMQGILFPTISSAGTNRIEMIRMVTQVHRLLFTFTAVIASSLAAVGPILIPLVFGKRFSASAISLAILAPGCAVFASTNILAAYFAGTGRPHINLINSLIGTAVTIALDLVVVPRWSFYGASVVSSLCYAATTLGSLIAFRRDTGSGFRELFVLTDSDWELGRRYCEKFSSQLMGTSN